MLRACLLVGLLLSAAVARAGEPAKFDGAEVRAAVARLADPDYRAREAASRAIDRAGDRALPLVKEELAKAHPPEAARRLEVLAERLAVARLKNPRRVTLKADRTPLDEVLKSITAQTGYAFKPGEGDGVAKKPVSVDLKDVPFLEALDRLCDGNDLAHFNREDDGVLTVNAQNSLDPVKAYAGPFRVTVTGVSRSNQLSLAGVPRRTPPVRTGDQLAVMLAVESEPKAPMVSLDKLEVVGAADDRGAAVRPPARDSDDEDRHFAYNGRGTGRTFTHNASVQLGPCDRAAQSLKHLTLKLTVTLLAETRVVGAVTDFTKAKGAKLAGRDVGVEITNYTAANGTTTIEMAARTTGNPERNGGAWAYQLVQRLQLVDGAGAVQPVLDTDVDDNGATATVRMTFRTPPRKTGGKPAAFQLVEWDSRSQDVTVTLKGVPLP